MSPALDVVCARRLQDGDTGGHVRRALAAFPVPRVAEWILAAYFVEGGIAPGEAYRPVPRHTVASGEKLLELTVAANFVEMRRVTSELADVDRALGDAEDAWLELEEVAP